MIFVLVYAKIWYTHVYVFLWGRPYRQNHMREAWMGSDGSNKEGMTGLHRVCLAVSWIVVFVIAAVFLVGQCVFKHNEFRGGRMGYLDGEWTYESTQGKTGTTTLPARLDLDLGEGVTFKTTLPDDIRDGMYLCLSVGKNMRVYIDGNLRMSHDFSDSELPGRVVKNAFFTLEISSLDRGKTIEIVRDEPGAFNRYLYEVRYGELYSIYSDLKKEYLFKFLMSTILFLDGVLVCIGVAILNIVFKVTNEPLKYLGFGTIAVSVWLITDSYMYSLFFENTYVDGVVSYMVAPIMAIPFFLYMNEIMEHRYENVCTMSMASLLLIDVVTTILHFTDIMSYGLTRPISNAMIGLTAIMLFVTIIKDHILGYSKKYKWIEVGILVMIVCTAIELLEVNLHIMTLNGLFLIIGLYFLLGTALVHSVRELIKTENERKSVIEANRVKSTFLANMSHEIRTPINSIMGMNEMILRENKDPDIAEYADHIKRSGKLLLSIIGEVLDLSKIEAGKLDIKSNPYNTANFIAETIGFLSEHAAEKGLEVKLDIEEEIPAVMEGDENHIKQILINLITNACKYTHEGQIGLRMYAEKSDELSAKERIFAFEVSDTGIGIKRENLGKLFDSFTRLDEKKNSGIQGTGLGLNIVKSLVEAMHGKVEVSSSYGIGSVFSVRIPQTVISEEPIEDSWRTLVTVDKQESYTATFTAPEAKILVVDDNASNLMIIRQLLKETKINIELADNGDEAIDLATTRRFDLFLLDHMMPHPDGLTVLKTIRANEHGINYRTPAIVLTANAVGNSRDEYLKYGFDDYLSKPVDGLSLEQMVMKYLPKNKIVQGDNGSKDADASNASATGTTGEAIANEQATKASEGSYDANFSKVAKMFGDENFALEVMNKVATDTLKHLDKMKSDLMIERYDDYVICAHAIKGMMASVYQEGLRARAKEHESAGKDGRYDYIKADFESFCRDCTDFCNIVLERKRD